ncbi:MAG: metallophosphoesterase [Acutalibacteraceae bacterium]
MIYVTGDTHGNINRFKEVDMHGKYTLTEDDYLIICGDFGFVFLEDNEEKEWLDELEQKPYTILWVDGNHENFKALYNYPNEIWNGGRIHRIRKNILHLMRGQVFNIEGKSFFTMGGAYSIDRYMRTKNLSYWDEELPDNSEYREAVQNLSEHNNETDYIITHTAPREIIRRMGRYPDSHDMELTGFFDWIMCECKFKHWYFGHWHEDADIGDRHTAVYHNLIKLS